MAEPRVVRGIRLALSPATESVSGKTPPAMLRYTVIFLLISLVAGILGFGGIAGQAAWIAKVCFLVFLVFAVISLLKKSK